MLKQFGNLLVDPERVVLVNWNMDSPPDDQPQGIAHIRDVIGGHESMIQIDKDSFDALVEHFKKEQ